MRRLEGRTGASGALFPWNWGLMEGAWAWVWGLDRAGRRTVVLAMVSLWETPWARGLRLRGASEPDLLIFTRLGRAGLQKCRAERAPQKSWFSHSTGQ